MLTLSLMTLGDRIRHARTAAGLKQPDVAKPFGISREAVAQWESAPPDKLKTQPRIEKLPLLADILRVNLRWLLSGEGDPETGMASDELQLLVLFRQLPESERPIVLSILKGMIDRVKAARQPDNPHPLQRRR